MDRLEGLDVTELIFITGHLKEQVEAYARTRYGYPCRFIEQKVQDGTAGAVNLARPYVTGAGADHLRGHGLRGRPVADQPHRRRRDHLGQGGRGLPALRRGGDRRRRLHDEDRREAVARRSPSSPTSASTTSGTSQALWAGHRPRARRARQQGRVLPDRRLPAHDRARPADPHRRGGRLVRLRQARTRCSRPTSILLEQGRRPAARLPRRARSSSRCTSRTACTIERSAIGPNVSHRGGHAHFRQHRPATRSSGVTPASRRRCSKARCSATG